MDKQTKILVDEKNRAKIEAAIKQGQGKSSKRCADFSDVKYAAETLRYIGSTLKSLEGSSITYTPGSQIFPKAYTNYNIPMGTYITISCIHSKFYLTAVGRHNCNRSIPFRVTLSESAKASIIERIELGYV